MGTGTDVLVNCSSAGVFDGVLHLHSGRQLLKWSASALSGQLHQTPRLPSHCQADCTKHPGCLRTARPTAPSTQAVSDRLHQDRGERRLRRFAHLTHGKETRVHEGAPRAPPQTLAGIIAIGVDRVRRGRWLSWGLHRSACVVGGWRRRTCLRRHGRPPPLLLLLLLYASVLSCCLAARPVAAYGVSHTRKRLRVPRQRRWSRLRWWAVRL